MSCSETVAIEYWVIIPLQIIHGFYLYAQSALIFILPVILISLYQCPILRALSRSVTLQNEKNLQPSLKKKKKIFPRVDFNQNIFYLCSVFI